MIKSLTKALIAGGLLSASVNVLAADLLIQNARIIGGVESTVGEFNDILIKGKRIAAIGSGIEVPSDTQVIDAKGRPVSSGLFNADTQLGLVEVGAVKDTRDGSSDNERVTASLRVSDAFNVSSVAIPYNRSLGLTHSLIQPSNGAGLFAGTASVIKLSDTNSIIIEQAAMVVSLGETGSELSGGSRAAAMATLREAMEDARDYANNKARFNSGDRRQYALSRHDLAALVPVVKRRLPLLVRVDRASDIERVIAFAKEQKVSLILSGVAEGWRVAQQIADAKVPVIFDPIYNLPSSYESLGHRLDNAKLLHEAGVKIMFTGMGWQNTHNAYLVRQSAGNAVANGLPYDVAIQAITSTPAQIFGLPGYGKIEVGADATLVLWSADPLEVSSNPDLVMIDGKQYSLESRATRLRDRYYNRLKQATK